MLLSRGHLIASGDGFRDVRGADAAVEEGSQPGGWVRTRVTDPLVTSGSGWRVQSKIVARSVPQHVRPAKPLGFRLDRN